LITVSLRLMTGVIALLLVALVSVACGDAPTPAPAPMVTPTAAPVPLVPTPAPTATQAASPVVSPLTLSVGDVTTGSLTTTAPATQSITISSVVDTVADCNQEVDLDLAGYQNLTEKMGCPLEAASFDQIGINEFGPGPEFDRFMLWFGSESKIYVLLPDKRWKAYDDTWSEDQALFTCNPLNALPTSPPLPRRGFNKIWCTVENLQTTMGTIVVEERLCQHAVVQRFEQGRLLACYEDATIRYIRLLDDGMWESELTR